MNQMMFLMNRYLILIPIITLLSALNHSYSQDTGICSLTAKGASLEKVADGFLFTEGPAADKEGNVYFTDQPNDRIMKWGVDGVLSTYLQPSGRSNGLFFDRSGNLFACADEKTELWRIAPGGEKKVIISTYNGRMLNGPNDLWIAPDGGIYFTDPYYKRPWWKHSEMPQEIQAVYYLAPGKSEAIRVETSLVKPNGIIGTPDGRILYVADIGDNKTYSFKIHSDGTLTEKRLFCELGSDGMTMDTNGNIYLTGKGVTIFDKTGKLICNIPVPENWTANVCFGGKDRKSLYITAMGGFYTVRMKTRGAW
jgi:gluconolactonase